MTYRPAKIFLIAAAVAALAIPLAGSVATAADPSASQLAASSQCVWSSCRQVLSWVGAGTHVGSVPSNLKPSLSAAGTDRLPPPGLNECLVGQSALVSPTPCVYNSGPNMKRMVLIGDSHALMWARAVSDLASQNGYEVLVLIRIPCPLPMVTFWNGLNNTPNTQCTTWKKWAFNRINQYNPSVVIAATEDFLPQTQGGTRMSQTSYSAGFATTLDDLKGTGRRVIVLGDIPFISPPPVDCLAAHESNVQVCSAPTKQAVLASHDAAEASAAKKAGATYINVVPWLCTVKVCPAIINGIDVYSDATHITSTYAEALEPVLGDALQLGQG